MKPLRASTKGRPGLPGAIASPARSLAGGSTPEPLAKGLVCAPGLLADGLRGTEAAQLPSPGGVAPVDLDALGGGQRGEGIALGGMQPAAAEVERDAVRPDRTGSPSEPRQCLHQQDGPPDCGKTPGRSDPRRARAHDDDVKELCHRRALPKATASEENARNARATPALLRGREG